jgi:hypothetical protein
MPTSYTVYLVTKRDPSAKESLEEVGTYEAGSRLGAVRKYLEEDSTRGGGNFVVPPTRHVRPMTVKVEQVRKVSAVVKPTRPAAAKP